MEPVKVHQIAECIAHDAANDGGRAIVTLKGNGERPNPETFGNHLQRHDTHVCARSVVGPLLWAAANTRPVALSANPDACPERPARNQRVS